MAHDVSKWNETLWKTYKKCVEINIWCRFQFNAWRIFLEIGFHHSVWFEVPLEEVYQSLGIRKSQPKVLYRISAVADRGDSFYIVSTNIAIVNKIIFYVRDVPKLRQLTKKFECFIQQNKLIVEVFTLSNWHASY